MPETHQAALKACRANFWTIVAVMTVALLAGLSRLSVRPHEDALWAARNILELQRKNCGRVSLGAEFTGARVSHVLKSYDPDYKMAETQGTMHQISTEAGMPPFHFLAHQKKVALWCNGLGQLVDIKGGQTPLFRSEDTQSIKVQPPSPEQRALGYAPVTDESGRPIEGIVWVPQVLDLLDDNPYAALGEPSVWPFVSGKSVADAIATLDHHVQERSGSVQVLGISVPVDIFQLTLPVLALILLGVFRVQLRDISDELRRSDRLTWFALSKDPVAGILTVVLFGVLPLLALLISLNTAFSVDTMSDPETGLWRCRGVFVVVLGVLNGAAAAAALANCRRLLQLSSGTDDDRNNEPSEGKSKPTPGE